jgi:DNA-binding PadR family transcriptional regulator
MIGRFQESILLLLYYCKTEMTSREIQDAFTEHLYPIHSGALYNTLDKLIRDNLVSREKGESLPVRGGKAQLHYAITDMGRKLLSDMKADRDKLEKAFSAHRPPPVRQRQGNEPKR